MEISNVAQGLAFVLVVFVRVSRWFLQNSSISM